MNKWIKRSAIGATTLILLAGAAIATGVFVAGRKLDRRIDVRVAAVDVDRSKATIDRGHYLFNSRGCAHCHGDNGSGREVINEDGLLVVAPNITTGPNSKVAGYSVVDWVRVLRHGIKPDQRPAFIMPSEDYARMSDEDTAAIIAYATQLPPVAGSKTVIELPLPVKLVYAAGIMRDAADKIDHTLPPAAPVAATVSVEHGKYLANMCMGCHGAKLSGGSIPGAPPSWPAAANLTTGKGSAMPLYADAAAFRAMMRSGRRPDGSAVNPAMPFQSLREMNDVDLDAMYAYFRTLPPVATGQN